MTSGFDHIHIIDGHEQRCFLGMFENEVCLERLAEKMPDEKVPGERENNERPVFRVFYCVVCPPLSINN